MTEAKHYTTNKNSTKKAPIHTQSGKSLVYYSLMLDILDTDLFLEIQYIYSNISQEGRCISQPSDVCSDPVPDLCANWKTT